MTRANLNDLNGHLIVSEWLIHSMWLWLYPDGSQGKNFENVVALGPALLCCPSGPIRMKGLECCRMLRQGLRLKVWFLHFHCTQFWFPIAILVHSRVADRTLKWTWTAMGRFEPFWTWESSIFFRLFTWFEYVVFTGHEVYKKQGSTQKTMRFGSLAWTIIASSVLRWAGHTSTKPQKFILHFSWCQWITGMSKDDVPSFIQTFQTSQELIRAPGVTLAGPQQREAWKKPKRSWQRQLGAAWIGWLELLAVDNLEFQDPAENRRWFFHGFPFQGLGRWSMVDSRRCHFWIEVKAGRITSKEDGFMRTWLKNVEECILQAHFFAHKRVHQFWQNGTVRKIFTRRPL